MLVGVVAKGFGRGGRVEFAGVGEDDTWSSRAASMEGRRGLSWLLLFEGRNPKDGDVRDLG